MYSQTQPCQRKDGVAQAPPLPGAYYPPPQQYQPPPQTYYSYGALPPRPTAPVESTPEEENWLWFAITSPFRPTTYLLIVYFLVNLVFAVISFAVVVALASIGIGLIPLCCIGLVILQLLLYTVYFLAHCDAFLYNCTAPQAEQITVSFDIPREGPYHYSGHRVSPNLAIFSKESVVAVFYFVFVKFPVAIISSAISLTLLASAIIVLLFPLYQDDYINHRGIFHNAPQRLYLGYRDVETIEPGQTALVGIVMLYLAIGCLYGFAKLLRWATKYFTCEFFATSGVLHLYSTLSYAPRQQYLPVYAAQAH
ncbi:hypothetical protein AeMF1_004902 [Aphanomyces euteiches]|nr:hypothetical protein AeMF1_004902 [Aphanomyces euteiches]